MANIPGVDAAAVAQALRESGELNGVDLTSLILYTGQGMALLDLREPDWWKQIQPGRLNMDQLKNCVLGQVYGDYHVGLAELRLTGPVACAYGFAGRYTRGVSRSCDVNEYPPLTLIWRAAVVARQTRAAAAAVMSS